MLALALALATAAFVLSASAGLGGSLIMIPGMCLLFGTKAGITLSAVLLGCNNVAKVIAYRSTIPYRRALGVLVLSILGAGLGAGLLLAAPESWVNAAVMASIGATLILENWGKQPVRRSLTPLLAFAAGCTSGFAGTSGPLKGIALRNLGLDRLHFVGAASLVSLGTDVTKAVVYLQGSILDTAHLPLILAAIPMMPLAALAGRRLNRTIGERAFAGLFWTVMGGYTLRLIL